MHVAERPGNERTRPVGVTRGRFRVEKRQDAAARLRPVFRRGAAIAGLVEACEAIPRITHPPFGDYADRAPNFTGNRTCRGAIRCHQHNLRFEPRAVLGFRRAHQAFELGALVIRQ